MRWLGTELEFSTCWNRSERAGGTTGSPSQWNMMNGARTGFASARVGVALFVPVGMTPPAVMAAARSRPASTAASPMGAKAPNPWPEEAERGGGGVGGAGGNGAARGHGGGAEPAREHRRVANGRERTHAVAEDGEAVGVHVGKRRQHVQARDGSRVVLRALAHVHRVGLATRGVGERR